eukprot:s2031_g3.t1
MRIAGQKVVVVSASGVSGWPRALSPPVRLQSPPRQSQARYVSSRLGRRQVQIIFASGAGLYRAYSSRHLRLYCRGLTAGCGREPTWHAHTAAIPGALVSGTSRLRICRCSSSEATHFAFATDVATVAAQSQAAVDAVDAVDRDELPPGTVPWCILDCLVVTSRGKLSGTRTKAKFEVLPMA